MNTQDVRRGTTAALVVLMTVGVTPAQVTQRPVEPHVGQPGKDVVWVPTAETLVEKMLDLAHVTPDDYVIDLGSGDGRTVIAAAKRGARTLGIEYEGDMVELSRRRAEQEHVANATFVQGDLFDADLSSATVITMFLLPELNLKLRPRLLALKPGTRVVSNSFAMEDWSADDRVTVQEGCETWCTALLWIVPARVEGTWRSGGRTFTLRQRFQMIDGTVTGPGGESTPISGKLRGADIVLNENGILYEGQVRGNAIEGKATSGGDAHPWSATRSGP